MKSFNENIIYKNAADCFSERMVERYLAGKLSDMEQGLMAKHLETCSFCSEAIEGIKLLEKPDQISTITNKINKNIDSKTSERPAYLGAKYAAAAVVLVLVSVGIYGYLNFNNAESELIYVQNFSKYPGKLNMDSVLTRLQAREENMEYASAADAVTTQSMNTDENVIEESNKNLAKIESAENKTVFSTPHPTTRSKQNPVTAEMQEADEEIAIEGMSIAEVDNFKINSDKVFESAMTHYDQNQYSEAVALFKKLKQEQKYTATSLLYTGISYLQLGQPQEAIDNFDKLLNVGNIELEETALWYKSLSLIKLNNINEAKATLKMVIEKKGLYREKARMLKNSL